MIEIMTVLFLIIGVVIGIWFSNMRFKMQIQDAKRKAQAHLESIKQDAEMKSRQIISDDKEDIIQYQGIANDEIQSQKEENETREQRLDQHEKYLEQMKNRLTKYTDDLNEQANEQKKIQDEIDDILHQAEDIHEQRELTLQSISRIDKNSARQTVLNDTENQLRREKDIEVKYNLSESKVAANKIANDLVIEAIQSGPRDEPRSHIERNINLPSNEIKAKLIGKDEQHIRLIQTLTGTDLIFDEDFPLLLHIVTHDPVRREIVRTTIESLIISRHFTNSNIEYLVNTTTQKVNAALRETGETVVHSLHVGRMHPDLMKIIGKLKFRTSYGQNVLYHSIESAQLAGALAAELGLNTQLAKRAGLLHDIGKAIDHEVGGTHVELGGKLTRAFNENEVVVNAIESHHGDVEPTDPISILVSTADAISGARPGARSESIEEYVTRLRNLENIANQHDGVRDSYAIQAGREIRIIVNPEMLDDDKSKSLTKHVKDQIQDELTYPGKIKVTTIRELKAVQYVGKTKKRNHNAIKEA
ncbi:ribonuclease Y [Apilactobacillus apinorum]|uniref:ribonuclease Y n=1 Tax=Apilactobacillus apinorum TaxID=1218495 RepID=UPI0006C11CC8|nr:ribonuclease Y [Apilactobacillus apinorum]KOY69676.1 Ribonuclease Y [Apilactobacillus apinorum]CAI2619662.1 cpdB Ribonuclease Y [Apilactobacillus apinorum]